MNLPFSLYKPGLSSAYSKVGRKLNTHHLSAEECNGLGSKLLTAGDNTGVHDAKVVTHEEQFDFLTSVPGRAPYHPRSCGDRSLMPELKNSKPPSVFSYGTGNFMSWSGNRAESIRAFACIRVNSPFK